MTTKICAVASGGAGIGVMMTAGNNKEKIKENASEYREANKEKISERKKVFYEANKDKIKEKKKEYCESNKEKINEKHRSTAF